VSLSPFVSFILRPLLKYWGRKARPQTRGEIRIPGLESSVRVLWGPYGIPHIFAASERDLFLAQGFLHAQERLWQMDLSRRSLGGRLAEIFGARPLPSRELSEHFANKSVADLDYFTRLLGLRRVACDSLSIVPEELLDRLAAYGDGVNRYIETHLKRLPIEFRLLRYEPEPWRPEDSLTIGKGFAFFLSTALMTRLTLTAIREKLQGQPAKLASLLPTHPADAPSTTKPAPGMAQDLTEFIGGMFSKLAGPGGGQGSNNWVVAPARSVTGKPILCNDPHLRLTLPSVWYLVHLKAASPGSGGDGLEVWGGSIPGSPLVHIGHNRRIAWGVTAALCDDADLYQERVHPEDFDLYLAGDRWIKMERIEETIRVRGGKELRRVVRLTRHGPVISDCLASSRRNEILALKWSAHERGEEIRVVDSVNRASNWEEFLAGLSFQVAPALNYVYADIRGNIGYALAGKIPRRSHANSFFPLPGWSEECDWKGYLRFDELPRLLNPSQGCVATANNRIADPAYPHYLSDLFEPPYRIRRIETLLQEKAPLSAADMAAIQRDAVSNHAGEVVGNLREDLEAISRDDSELRLAVEELRAWDGTCSEESVAAAIFHVFHLRLLRGLLTPELGEKLTLAYLEIMNQPLQPFARILADANSPWFEASTRRVAVASALREACAELTEKLGADIQKWRWGKIHTLTLHHPLDRSKLIGPIFSIGPFPAAGDGATINMGHFRYSDPYSYVVGPSLRMIVPLGDWQQGLFVIPSGQSGHFISRHYSDQTELWRRGEYLRLYYREEEMKAWPVLEMVPV
jgi:penicillin G amidase